MNIRFNAISAVALAVLASGAHANLTLSGQASNGNSSAVFVALYGNQTRSLVVDLGVQMSAFLAAPGTQGVPLGATTSAGLLSGQGTLGTWNFASNTFVVNGVAQSGNYNWASTTSSFFSGAAANGGYTWGVIAGDTVSGSVSGTNVVRGQNILFTSNITPVDYDNSNATGVSSGTIADGANNVTNYLEANNGTGTHTLGVSGASTAVSGEPFLGYALAADGLGNFGREFGNNNFLLAPNQVSRFTWATSATFPTTLYSIGNVYGVGADAAIPATFTWNAASNSLVYAVPEPSTYALMLVGLAGLGVLARRRRS